ncbi:MAG: Type 1 glutamine amidotransferase-like domain-containing protein [Actinomycetota bacterium]
MDRAVLDRSGGEVAVLAGAARRGADYAGALARARQHYDRLGGRVVDVPDPRDDVDGALAVLDDQIDLVVMPGGSPALLREVLIDLHGGSVGQRLVDRWRAGVALSGASAGAMLLCSQTAVPGSAELASGLGLVMGIAVPHWTEGSETRWSLPDDVELWGLPECGGVLIERESMVAVGEGDPSIRVDGRWRPIAR